MKTFLAALLLTTTLLGAQSVKHINRIYVNELHCQRYPDPDMEAMVRSKLISSLVKDCGSRCTVVEENGDDNEDSADGVLTGAMSIQTDGNGYYRVQGAMRLIAKDGSIVWADTVYSHPFARSASSSFADNVAKRLTMFLAEAK